MDGSAATTVGWIQLRVQDIGWVVFCGIGTIAIAMGWRLDKSGALVHLVFG